MTSSYPEKLEHRVSRPAPDCIACAAVTTISKETDGCTTHHCLLELLRYVTIFLIRYVTFCDSAKSASWPGAAGR